MANADDSDSDELLSPEEARTALTLLIAERLLREHQENINFLEEQYRRTKNPAILIKIENVRRKIADLTSNPILQTGE